MLPMPRTFFPTLTVLVTSFLTFTANADTNGHKDDLSRHDFFYAGESKRPRMYIVKDGQVAWEHVASDRRGEISDAILFTDGNMLIAHQYGLAEITPERTYKWTYDAPKGCEIHTVQPIGEDKVVFVQNGKPAKVIVMEIASQRVLREFPLPILETGSVHSQFRNARLTSRGTLLVANSKLDYVGEYDSDGNEIARWDMPGPWSVSEVGNSGNLLMVGRGSTIREVDRQGNIVCERVLKESGVNSAQKAVRLKNGNTIVNSWFNEWGKTPLDSANAPLQAIEINPAGEVVWTLCSWRNPDLGPSTTIQPLDQAIDRNKLFFGEFK